MRDSVRWTIVQLPRSQFRSTCPTSSGSSFMSHMVGLAHCMVVFPLYLSVTVNVFCAPSQPLYEGKNWKFPCISSSTAYLASSRPALKSSTFPCRQQYMCSPSERAHTVLPSRVSPQSIMLLGRPSIEVRLWQKPPSSMRREGGVTGPPSTPPYGGAGANATGTTYHFQTSCHVPIRQVPARGQCGVEVQVGVRI